MSLQFQVTFVFVPTDSSVKDNDSAGPCSFSAPATAIICLKSLASVDCYISETGFEQDVWHLMRIFPSSGLDFCISRCR